MQENGAAQQAGLLTLSKQEFHNSTVERLPWQGAAFSQDSEHMVGVTPEHKIYAWSLHTGKLEKFLEFEGELPSPPVFPEVVPSTSRMDMTRLRGRISLQTIHACCHVARRSRTG